MQYDVIVIGAGPAGMTSAIYLRRASKNVLVLEARSYGGQIVNAANIENYPAAAHISGFDLATALYGQAKELGTEFKFEKALGIEKNGNEFTVTTRKNKYKAKTVIIAVGSRNRKLGLENEDRFIGRGISYCATCDGAFFRNKDVAVVGGGNTAVDDALYLADIAKTVFLIHRRDAFRADGSTVNKLKTRENVNFILNSRVTKLNGENSLSSVELTDGSGASSELKLDGLFVAIGQIPETSQFSDLIELESAGYAVSGENCRTATPGLFVAGDCRFKDLRQIVTAASDGAVAASEAVKYLTDH